MHQPVHIQDYRPNVGVCLVNRHGMVFAATRVDDPTKSWQMPQGGIDPGEEPLAAAVRELQEETSISSVQVLAEAQRWLSYDFPPEARARLSSYWARYKGQAQRWFLFKFTGDDSEVDLATSHREFSEWRWMPLEQLPGAVVPFKKPVYEAVLAEFGPAVEAVKAEERQLQP
ncbi:NUDIX hydrolase domain-like protein [Scenedesmus sp. NREL 46B-D3]|nr:NUDIX hydrolase domain-like protein [Scenedesmus sp. NREL 46B-D3]